MVLREKFVLERARQERFALTFDDVSLVPRYSEILPSEANLETRLTRNIKLNIPFVTADMDTVTEGEMAREIAKLGGMGFIWKIPNGQDDKGRDIDDKGIVRQEEEVSKVKYTLNRKIDKPVIISPEQTIADAKKILAEYENRFSTLIVCGSDMKVVGLLGREQMQRADNSQKVSERMNRHPITSERDFSVREAYDFMKEKDISKLILVDGEGILRGLYCAADVWDIVEKANPACNRDDSGQLRVGANVGVKDFERAERLLKRHCDVLLVGTAHGDSKRVIETVRELKRQFTGYKFDVLAGNVVTPGGVRALIEAGADGVKLGVGPGSICTTRITTGVGVPQLSAIYECALEATKFDVPVMGDGGVVYSGYVPKAFAAGADSVMAGGIFAATEEAPGKIIIFRGKTYKLYRGMGSEGAMKDAGGGARYNQKSGKSVPEGVEGRVLLRGNLENVVFQFVGGLRSAMGYLGTRTIPEIQEYGDFVRVTAAGVHESHPHDIEITEEAPNYHGRLD